MIKSFRHRGLERFFRTGSKAGIQPKHAKRLRLQLGRLDSAKSAEDMNLPGWKWHLLKHGGLAGHWSVWVDENYRQPSPSRALTPCWWIIRTITEDADDDQDAHA